MMKGGGLEMFTVIHGLLTSQHNGYVKEMQFNGACTVPKYPIVFKIIALYLYYIIYAGLLRSNCQILSYCQYTN